MLGMLMRTWDYRGFAIGSVLTPLASIFDWKNSVFFFEKRFFWFLDKSADMADFYEKKLGKVVYTQIWPDSII